MFVAEHHLTLSETIVLIVLQEQTHTGGSGGGTKGVGRKNYIHSYDIKPERGTFTRKWTGARTNPRVYQTRGERKSER